MTILVEENFAELETGAVPTNINGQALCVFSWLTEPSIHDFSMASTFLLPTRMFSQEMGRSSETGYDEMAISILESG